MSHAAVGKRKKLLNLLTMSLLASAAAGLTSPAQAAANCVGNADAIGTSRTIVVDPNEHTRIGTMQYGETLPLRDREVVLTFDDGPIPKYSNQVIETLRQHCAKATFFIIGRMARAYPEGVRKLVDAGHTVGTHTENHPLSMNRMALDRAQKEIETGIASVRSALNNPDDLAPFFRIPGLLRAGIVEDYLASRGIQTWSADFPADDWQKITAEQVRRTAIERIEAKGKGILLLHDIQPRTVGALPLILKDLKDRGYRIVHVVPATPTRPATPTTPQDWKMHQSVQPVASVWPKTPRRFNYVHTAQTPAPAQALSQPTMLAHEAFNSFDLLTMGKVPLRGTAAWLEHAHTATSASALPAPAENLFQIVGSRNSAAKSSAVKSAHSTRRPASDGIARLISVDAAESRHKGPVVQ